MDLAQRRMSPRKCELLCSQCAAVRDLPGLIGRITRQHLKPDGKDDAQISELLRHFLKVNGHDAADAHLLQDAVSVAHAMMVIYGEFRLPAAKGPELPALLGGGAAASTAGQGPA